MKYVVELECLNVLSGLSVFYKIECTKGSGNKILRSSWGEYDLELSYSEFCGEQWVVNSHWYMFSLLISAVDDSNNEQRYSLNTENSGLVFDIISLNQPRVDTHQVIDLYSLPGGQFAFLSLREMRERIMQFLGLIHPGKTA